MNSTVVADHLRILSRHGLPGCPSSTSLCKQIQYTRDLHEQLHLGSDPTTCHSTGKVEQVCLSSPLALGSECILILSSGSPTCSVRDFAYVEELSVADSTSLLHLLFHKLPLHPHRHRRGVQSYAKEVEEHRRESHKLGHSRHCPHHHQCYLVSSSSDVCSGEEGRCTPSPMKLVNAKPTLLKSVHLTQWAGPRNSFATKLSHHACAQTTKDQFPEQTRQPSSKWHDHTTSTCEPQHWLWSGGYPGLRSTTLIASSIWIWNLAVARISPSIAVVHASLEPQARSSFSLPFLFAPAAFRSRWPGHFVENEKTNDLLPASCTTVMNWGGAHCACETGGTKRKLRYVEAIAKTTEPRNTGTEEHKTTKQWFNRMQWRWALAHAPCKKTRSYQGQITLWNPGKHPRWIFSHWNRSASNHQHKGKIPDLAYETSAASRDSRQQAVQLWHWASSLSCNGHKHPWQRVTRPGRPPT